MANKAFYTFDSLGQIRLTESVNAAGLNLIKNREDVIDKIKTEKETPVKREPGFLNWLQWPIVGGIREWEKEGAIDHLSWILESIDEDIKTLSDLKHALKLAPLTISVSSDVINIIQTNANKKDLDNLIGA
jgi:hypothetical protein